MATKTDHDARDHVIGQQVGASYVIGWWIGAGGMGSVYGAESAAFGGLKIAVKVLTTKDHAAVERFNREAFAAGVISDPFSVVRLIDTGVLRSGEHYIALEYCDGGSLEDVLRNRGPNQIPLEDTLGYMSPICSALVKAHLANVVHRDLKPANVLLVKDGTVKRAKLTDFGIAKLRERTGLVMTGPNLAMGTPGYMSPEQCLQAAEVDSRSDIYSLGCMIYELVTGRLPFLGSTPQLIHQTVNNAPIIPPSRLRRGVPEAIDHTIMKCLAHRREDRMQSALEVIRGLAAGVENGDAKMAFFAPNLIDHVVAAPTAKTMSGPASSGQAVTVFSEAAGTSVRRSKRRAAALFFTGATLGACLAGGVLSMLRPGSSTTPADVPALVIASGPAPATSSTAPTSEPAPTPPAPSSATTTASAPPPAPSSVTTTASAPPPATSSVTTTASAPPPAPSSVTSTASASPPAPSSATSPARSLSTSSPASNQRGSTSVLTGRPPPTPSRPQGSAEAVTTRPPPNRAASDAPSTTRTEAWLSIRVKGLAEVSIDGDTPGTAPRRKRVRVGEHHVVMTGYPDGSEQRREFDVTVPATKEETVIYKSW